MIEDTFPYFLGQFPQLQVLVLRSSKFHGFLNNPTGNYSLLKLQILDLSDNNLSGSFPMEYFNNYKAMMTVDQDMQYMGSGRGSASSYTNSVSMTWKRVEIKFIKIQSALAIMDLSSNNFTGKLHWGSLNHLNSLTYLTITLQVISNHHWGT